MNRDQKSAVIEEIAGQIQEAQAVFAVDYRGISVPQAAELRGRLRDSGASFRVVKNSLTERAADRAGAERLKELLDGPTALAFVHGDAAVAAKAMADYARATDLLAFKGGLLDGEPLDAEQMRAIARLPAREILYGQLVGVVASPVSGLVRTLHALIQGIAVALGQIAEQGLVTGEDPPETPDTGEAVGATAESSGAPEEPAGATGGSPEAQAPVNSEAPPDGGPVLETPADGEPADAPPAETATQPAAEQSAPDSAPADDDTDAAAPSNAAPAEEKE